jgi:hypothetical protein
LVPGVLCYVSHGDAYFTTAPLDEQWGDDWDDAPYEHNAEPPYDRDGRSVTLVKFDPGRLGEPHEKYGNSPWSVEQINRRVTPWLSTDHDWMSGIGEPIHVWAGADFATFRTEIERAGGVVFVPLPAASGQAHPTPEGGERGTARGQEIQPASEGVEP